MKFQNVNKKNHFKLIKQDLVVVKQIKMLLWSSKRNNWGWGVGGANKKMALDKSILAFWRQIHLKIQCQPHGTWQFSEIQYKSDRGREKKHPAAGQGSTRSQNSRQIEFSSRNGREISSSVYGTTRCPQLYLICTCNYVCISSLYLCFHMRLS